MSTIWAVHVSDLHFGHKVSGGGLLGGLVPKATAHDLDALKMLSLFLQRFVIKRKEKKVLIVSGDATALGHPNEFAMYRTMLDRGWSIDAHQSLPALIDGFDAVLELPGNHDYWDGIPLNPVLSTSARSLFFPPSRASISVPFDSHNALVFHTLCSTSGAGPMTQPLAVGEFAPGEVQSVTTQIQKAKAQTLGVHQILITHHSPSYGRPGWQGLTANAQGTLDSLRRTVAGVLTGHAHKKNIDRRPGGLAPEVRSPSTLQAPLPRGSAENGFYVHRFELSAGPTLGWSAVDYTFTKGSFLPVRLRKIR